MTHQYQSSNNVYFVLTFKITRIGNNGGEVLKLFEDRHFLLRVKFEGKKVGKQLVNAPAIYTIFVDLSHFGIGQFGE